jgi:hypothetical protein
MSQDKGKIPVMSNIYFSNTVTMNKRPNPFPPTVDYKYAQQDRINKFHPPGGESPRRLVAETFKASDRNHKIPTTTSPLMMTAGVAPQDKIKEMSKT